MKPKTAQNKLYLIVNHYRDLSVSSEFQKFLCWFVKCSLSASGRYLPCCRLLLCLLAGINEYALMFGSRCPRESKQTNKLLLSNTSNYVQNSIQLHCYYFCSEHFFLWMKYQDDLHHNMHIITKKTVWNTEFSFTFFFQCDKRTGWETSAGVHSFSRHPQFKTWQITFSWKPSFCYWYLDGDYSDK